MLQITGQSNYFLKLSLSGEGRKYSFFHQSLLQIKSNLYWHWRQTSAIKQETAFMVLEN